MEYFLFEEALNFYQGKTSDSPKKCCCFFCGKNQSHSISINISVTLGFSKQLRRFFLLDQISTSLQKFLLQSQPGQFFWHMFVIFFCMWIDFPLCTGIRFYSFRHAVFVGIVRQYHSPIPRGSLLSSFFPSILFPFRHRVSCHRPTSSNQDVVPKSSSRPPKSLTSYDPQKPNPPSFTKELTRIIRPLSGHQLGCWSSSLKQEAKKTTGIGKEHATGSELARSSRVKCFWPPHRTLRKYLFFHSKHLYLSISLCHKYKLFGAFLCVCLQVRAFGLWKCDACSDSPWGAGRRR